MRDLLTLLREFKVQGFTQGEFAITFARDLDEDLVSVDGKQVRRTDDEDEVEIVGFREKTEARPSGFKHPGLWKDQGGKPYSFTE